MFIQSFLSVCLELEGLWGGHLVPPSMPDFTNGQSECQDVSKSFGCSGVEMSLMRVSSGKFSIHQRAELELGRETGSVVAMKSPKV